MGNLTTEDIIVLLTAMVLLLAVGVTWRFLRIARKNQGRADVSLPDLKGLEAKRLLTKEEMKKVREAMARQYLEQRGLQEQEEVKQSSMKPLDSLALEAEKAEQIVSKKKSEKGEGTSPESVQEPKEIPERNDERADEPVKSAGEVDVQEPQKSEGPALRPELEKLKDHPEQELEDMKNAGFLEEEDFELLMEVKRNEGCRKCS